jgi:uncharacterized protein YcfL
MVLKKYMVLLAGLVLVAACRSSHSATASNKTGVLTTNGTCNVGVAAGNPVVDWKKETSNVLKDANTTIFPATYSVYSLDSASMKTFFMAAKQSKEDSRAEIVVPLPSPIGCRVFSVFESGTMSDELKQRFPDIVTLKGADKESPLTDIRLEYNGRMMQGQVVRDGETYFIKPVTSGNKFYYLVYSKTDAQQPKQDFEKDAESTRNDNKPVILKYDR